MDQNAPSTRRLKFSAKRTRPKGLKEITMIVPANLVDMLCKKFSTWRPANAIRILMCAALKRPDLLSDDRVGAITSAKKRAEIAVEQLKDGQKVGWADFRKSCYDLCKQGCFEDSRAYTDTVRKLMQTFVIPAKVHNEACWEWIRQLERYQDQARRSLEEHSKLGMLIQGPPPCVGAYLVVKSDGQFYTEINHPNDPLLEDDSVLYHFPVPTVSEYLKEDRK